MGGREIDHVQAAFAANYIAPVGPQLTAFEEAFRAATGFSHAVAVSSGTAAMHLALRLLGVGPGDLVLASSLTFIGSVSPIVMQGATPVFIDSDASFNLDPHLVAEEVARLVRLGRPPRAIVPTDLYGQPCDLAALRAIADPHGIPVVDDAAEALGATRGGRSVGRDARAAVFSFNGNKIITTSGGGMLAAEDGELIARARHLATQAREPVVHFEHREVGYNYRMSNVVAAIGLGQLEVLAERVRRRREIFDRYQARLSDLPGLQFMPRSPCGESTCWLTVVLIDPQIFGADAECVRLALERENIESRPVWKPMHLQPAFAGCRVVGGAVSERLFRTGLCLPSGTAMRDDEVDRVADRVAACARGGAA
jgi:dTDP-4-amino-4,6-dideoxygalactose transaminase